MRVAIVSESFLPEVNGVTGSVQRVCEHLERRGHQALVVAPGPGPTTYAGAQVVRTPSVPLPGYASFRLARPWGGLSEVLSGFAPDVVHLASPAVLGAQGARVAQALGLPSVAVYQTDLAGFAGRYGLGVAESTLWSWVRRIHATAARTLAPSRHAVEQLRDHGVQRVARWSRGVDLERFAPSRRDLAVRARLAEGAELVVGYVGRLAHEKQVELLGGLAGLPGVRLVVVGDGPQRASLERSLPHASFLGQQGGTELATTFASLDVFVHTGAHETFCQAAQEAKASGLPVVAPAAGGLLDVVEDGLTGLHFAPGSASDLRRQVERLVGTPDLRAQLGRQARRSVEGRSWSVIGDQLLGHYEAVLARDLDSLGRRAA